MQAIFFIYFLFFVPDGKNWTPSLWPESRHRKVQTRLISARFTWSQMEGAQCEKRQWRKNKIKRRGKKGKDQYRLTITLVSAWGNGHPYCISTRDGSPWSGEARILLMHLTFGRKRTGQTRRNVSGPYGWACKDAVVSTKQCCSIFYIYLQQKCWNKCAVFP